MEKNYEQSRYYLAVDCVIFGYEDGELKLLLYPRAFDPYKGAWSLMGGFLSEEDQNLADAARRVLLLRAGLDNIFLKEVGTFSDKDREVEERVVSVAHYALVRIDTQDVGVLFKHGARWWPIHDLPPMVLDHQQMVEAALTQLQKEANEQLLGKELLPEMFTLLQLRNVYQAIFGRDFELANFRKKILSMNILKKQELKNKTESRKGAHYFSFIPEAENKIFDRIVKLT